MIHFFFVSTLLTERIMIFDDAGYTANIAGLKLHKHECLLGHVVFAAYAKAHSGRETEARVIPGVSQYNNGAESELPALLKADPYQRRPDAFAPMRG
jgi:hypothetical protein